MSITHDMFFVAEKLEDTEYQQHDYHIAAGPYPTKKAATQDLYNAEMKYGGTPVVVTAEVKLKYLSEVK